MKKWIKLAVFALFMCLSCCFVVACESPKYSVTINFINAEEELGFETYTAEVAYGMSVPLELYLPAGYDHTKIRFGLKDKEITIDDWEVNFEKTLPENEKQYEYSIAKTIKYTISFVTQDMVFNIDMSEAGKETFEINLDNKFAKSYVQAVAINEESLERLLVLDDNNSHMLTRHDNTITARFGDYVALVYNRTKNQNGDRLNAHNGDVNAFYGDVLHFTDKQFKRSEGKLLYTEYPVASKGNIKYYYNGDSNTFIYYLGQVKEDMNIYAGIPNYQEKLGFDLKETYGIEAPNTFYLLSTSNDYSAVMKDIRNETEESIYRTASTPISVEVYRKSNNPYDANNENMDKIDGNVVLEKIVPENDMTRLYNRYDGYKLYVGEDSLAKDNLLNSQDKLTTAEELYVRVNFDPELYEAVKYHIRRLKVLELTNKGYPVIEEEIDAYVESTYLERAQSMFKYQIIPYETYDLDKLNDPNIINLIKDCNTCESTGNNYPNIVSMNGNYYVKVDKEILSSYVLDRSFVDGSTAYDYKTGTAILYVSFHSSNVDGVLNILDPNHPETNYFSRIALDCTFASDTYINPNDYRIHAYIEYEKAGTFYRDFGFIDYIASEKKEWIHVYFKTSIFVDMDNNFIDNYYIYIMGTEYRDFTTPKITQISYTDSKGLLDYAKEPIPASYKGDGLHGIASFKFDFNDQYPNDPTKEAYGIDQYGCALVIDMQHTLASNYYVSFKNCEALVSNEDNLYVTTIADVYNLNDFSKITFNRKYFDNLAKIGNSADIYYFMDSDKDFDIYLDPNNKATKVTETKTLCDITGKPITIDLGYGKPREVKVKYITPVYETFELSPDGYYFFAV